MEGFGGEIFIRMNIHSDTMEERIIKKMVELTSNGQVEGIFLNY